MTASENNYFATAYPIYNGYEVSSAIILYKSLDDMYLLINDLRIILLVFVGIASIITTIFSFFYRIE